MCQKNHFTLQRLFIIRQAIPSVIATPPLRAILSPVTDECRDTMLCSLRVRMNTVLKSNRRLPKGVTPKEYVDEIVKPLRAYGIYEHKLWQIYPHNRRLPHETVQKISRSCMTRATSTRANTRANTAPLWKLLDRKPALLTAMPRMRTRVTEAKEEAYFFKMSPFADRIEKLLTETDYLQPKTRAVELVNNFIKPGLEDLYREQPSNGAFLVTFDEKHIVYVWIDALSNYISALTTEMKNLNEFDKYWVCRCSYGSKDIMRFHAIIWPAMLMALDLPLPKHLAVHGWITSTDRRCQSHSAMLLIRLYSASVTVLTQSVTIMREMALGADSSFSNEIMINRINSGPCKRSWQPLFQEQLQWFENSFRRLYLERRDGEFDDDLIETATSLRAKVDDFMDKTRLRTHLPNQKLVSRK